MTREELIQQISRALMIPADSVAVTYTPARTTRTLDKNDPIKNRTTYEKDEVTITFKDALRYIDHQLRQELVRDRYYPQPFMPETIDGRWIIR